MNIDEILYGSYKDKGENTSIYTDIINSKRSGDLYTDVDLKKYNEYDISVNKNNIDKLDYELAEKQGTFEKFRHGFEQAIVNEVALGIPKSFADLFDIVVGGAMRAGTGEETDYTNPVSKFLGDVQEQFKEFQPVYETPGVNILNGGIHDAGWWASNIPSIFTSLSMLVPSTVAVKGVTLASRATGLNKLGTKALKFATNIEKIDKLADEGKQLNTFQKLSQDINNNIKVANDYFKIGANATVSRMLENYTESGQVFDDLYNETYYGSSEFAGLQTMDKDTYNEFINKHSKELEGVDTSDRRAVAKRIAKLGADETFKLDAGNIVFDVVEMYGLKNGIAHFKNAPLRASIRAKHEESLRYFKPGAQAEANTPVKDKLNLLRKAKYALFDGKAVVAGQLSEGAEEVVNYIAQEEGMHYGHVLLGTEVDNKWDERLVKYFQSPQLYDSLFWGVMGGVAFQAGGAKLGQARNAIKKIREDKKNKKDTDETTKETSIKKLYYDYWQTEETKDRINDIENRQIKYNEALSQNKSIRDGFNPFVTEADGQLKRIENDEEAEVLRNKVVNNHDIELLFNSMFNGNWDWTKSYLASNEVRDALVDAGLLTSDEAKQRQQHIMELADKLEESFNRNCRAVSNAMRSADGKFNTDLSSYPLQYVQIIARENMKAELLAEDITNEIAKLDKVATQEENRVKEELANSGIDYKEVVRTYTLSKLLAQANAEIDAIEKRSNAENLTNVDARTISGQNALRNLKRYKSALEGLLLNQESAGKNKDDARVNKIARLITNAVVNSVVTLDENNNYKIDSNAEKAKAIDKAIVDLMSDANVFNVKVLTSEIPQLSPYVTEDIIKGIEQYKTINDTLNKVFSKNDKRNLADLSKLLLDTYSKRAVYEAQLADTKAQIVKDKKSIKEKAHQLHNEINGMRGAAIEMSFNSIKGLAEKYKDKFNSHKELSEAFAYGTTNEQSRKIIKNLLSAEDLRIYDDCMKIISLNNAKVTGYTERKETSLANSLLPEIIQNALYKSSEYSFKEVSHDVDDVNTNTQQSSTNTQQNAPQSTSIETILAPQNQQTSNPSQQAKSSVTGQANTQIGDWIDYFSNTFSGIRMARPFAEIHIDSNTGTIRLSRVTDANPANANANRFEILKTELTKDNPDFVELNAIDNSEYVEDNFADSKLFRTDVAIKDGGVVIKNPVVRINQDRTIEIAEPGVIGLKEANDNNASTSSPSPTGGSLQGNNIVTSDNAIDKNGYVKAESFDDDAAAKIEQTLNQRVYDDRDTLEEIFKELKPIIVNHFKRLKKNNETFSDTELREEAVNKLKDKYDIKLIDAALDESELFIEKGIEKLSKATKEESAIDDAISNSYLFDTERNFVERDKARKALNKAFDEILNNFIKHTAIDEYDGKKIISLENLMRYIIDVSGDKVYAEVLYKHCVEILSNNKEYTLLEGNKTNKTTIINNASKSSEEVLTYNPKNNGRSININSLLETLDDTEKESVYDVIDKLNVDDELEFEVDGNKITFSKNGVAFGVAYAPTVNPTSYSMINKGWIVDIPKVSDGTQSKLEQFFINIMVNPNDVDKYENIRKLVNKLYHTPQYVKNAETGANETNFEFLALCEEFWHALNENNIDTSEILQKKDVSAIQHLISIYAEVSKLSSQYLTASNVKNPLQVLNTNRINSIHNWFEKRKDSYLSTMYLINNPTATIRVDNIPQGGIILTSDKDARPTNEKGVLGSKTKENVELVVADITRQNVLIYTNGKEQTVNNITGGSTFIAIPNDKGNMGLVHAFPQYIKHDNGTAAATAIYNDVVSNVTRLLTDWMSDVNKSVAEIEKYLNSLSGYIDNNKPLFGNMFVTRLTSGYSGIQIKLGNTYIKLFDRNTKKENSSVVYFGKGDAHQAVQDKELQKQIIDRIIATLNDNLKYNLTFDFIKGIRETNGMAKINANGEFVISLSNGTELKFNSYKDFVIDNGIIKVKTKSEDGKTNFRKPSDEIKKDNNVKLTFKIENGSAARRESGGEVNTPSPIQSTDNTYNEVKAIINSNKKDNLKEVATKLLDSTKLNILKNSKIFNAILRGRIMYVPSYKDAIAFVARTDTYLKDIDTNIPGGVIVVTDNWFRMLDENDKEYNKESAFSQLIHECTHRAFGEQNDETKKLLYSELKKIFNKFKDYCVKNNYTKLSQYFFEDDASLVDENKALKDKGAEEFLVESLTRPELMYVLNQIPEPEDSTISNVKLGSETKGTLFSKILNLIVKLFDLNINKGSLLEKEYKLLQNLANVVKESKTEKVDTPSNDDETITSTGNNDDTNKDLEANESNSQAPTEVVIKTDVAHEDTFIKFSKMYDSLTKPLDDELQQIIDEAEKNGTLGLAPNGKPSNLNIRQWAQVRTKAFIDWFGDWINDPANASKIVDENGEPLVVYHGSRANVIKSFNIPEGIMGEEVGVFFSSDIEYAKKYGYAMQSNDYLYPAFLNIRKPETNVKIDSEQVVEYRIHDFLNNKKSTIDGLIGHDDWGGEQNPSKGVEFVVFNPNQIKSATDNVGTFSNDEDNIYMSKLYDTKVSSTAEIRDSLNVNNRKKFEKFVDEGIISLFC